MNATQRIRLGLLLTNLKLGGRFSFRTFVNDKDYPKDPDPKNWRTIHGSKVHLTNGKIDGGAGEKFQGNEWHGKVAHGSNSHFPPKGWVKPPPPPKEPPKAPEPDPFTPEVVSLPKKQAKVGLPGLGTHYANMLKGSYKNASPEVKSGVDEAFKQAKKMHSSKAQQGVFIDQLGIDNTSDAELAQKVFEAAKNKQITPLAAKNVMAALAAKKHSLVTNSLKKEMGMQGSAAAPAATPPAAKNETTSTNAFVAQGIVKQMDIAGSKEEQKSILMAAGLTKSQASEVISDYDTDKFTGNNDAVKTLEYFLNSNKKTSPTTSPTIKTAKSKIDLTKVKEQSQHWDDMDEDDQSKYLQDLSGKFNIPTEKAALLMNLLQKPGFTDTKAEEKIKEWGGSVTQGVYKTPKNFNPHDYSESAIGWKLPKDTMMPFKKSSDSEFKNYEIHSDADCMSMTKPQLTSVWRYTAGSEHIRDWLVYGKADTSWKDDDKEYKYKNKNWDNPYKNGMTGAAIQKVADDISKGLKKIDHPDMIVNRKCSLMDWATKDNPKGVSFEDLLQMAKTGEVFENKAFLSTSPMQGSTYGDSSACRHIYVPKKAVGGYIASVSEYKSEKEFLLDKKTKTRIMKVEKDKKGTIHIYEEVVLDD
jgi:hypothetical protein